MSAFLIKDKLTKAINTKKYSFLLVNFANTDMVGHTGNLKATIKAVEAVDKCLGDILAASNITKSCLIVTADHGNAEQMKDKFNKETHTAHTNNLVPFFIHHSDKTFNLKEGSLIDIAPTILSLLNLDIPKEMNGKSLLY